MRSLVDEIAGSAVSRRFSVAITGARHAKVAASAIAAALFVLAGPVLADTIDGEWCSPEGRHLAIHGQEVTTPGGATVVGTYSANAYSYVVPRNEPGGGGTVYMSLIDETTIQVRDGTPVALPTIWKRCERSI